MENKKVTIIGGGILGLTLAYRLSEKGLKVTVVEKLSEWGGLASGIKVGTAYLEKYYHHLFKSDESIQSLLGELGIDTNLDWHESSMAIYSNNEVYDFSSIFDLLRFRKLSLIDRFRLGFMSLPLQKLGLKESYNSITALEWCKKYFGDEVTEVMWEALLRGKFGKYYDKVAMAWLYARINIRSSSRPNPFGKEYLGYIDGGFQVLVERLVEVCKANGVELINDASVIGHKQKNKKHFLTYLKNDKKTTIKSDIVISTIPGPIFLKVFKVPNEFANKIKQIKYIGASVMILFLKNSFMPNYWLNVNDTDFPFMAVIEHTKLIPKESYGDDHILYIAKYIDPGEDLFKKSAEELIDIYMPFLQKINPEFSQDWIKKQYFFKSAFAQHIVTTDYEVPSQETGIDNLYYLNFTQIYPEDRGTNFAVEQADSFAKKLFEILE